MKLWLEHDGRIGLSDYRVRLLELVRDTGSLSDAAAQMRLSYRRAWGKVKELEHNLGIALVQSEAGGAGGGHTRLTAEGEALVARFLDFRDRMEQALAREYAASFGRDAHSPDPLPRAGREQRP